MEVQHFSDAVKGHFFILKNGEEIGKMNYFILNDKQMSVYHIEVSNSFKGKGLAKVILDTGVAYARKNDFKIKPACSWVKSVLESSEEYCDILA